MSYTFILIDMLGGLLNDLSLAFADEFDGLAAASYTLVIVSRFFSSVLSSSRLDNLCAAIRFSDTFVTHALPPLRCRLRTTIRASGVQRLARPGDQWT